MFRTPSADDAQARPRRRPLPPWAAQRLARLRGVVRGPSPAAQQARYEPLLTMFEALRRQFAPRRVAPKETPTRADVAVIQNEALRASTFSDFFEMVSLDGDLDRAAVVTTRRLLERSEQGRARTIAQVLQRYDALRPAADICLALCTVAIPLPAIAWQLFTGTDLGLVIRCAAGEYFDLGFDIDADTAAATLRRVLDGELALDADADLWLRIADRAFAAGAHELAARTVERAELAVAADPARAERQRRRVANLRTWLDRAPQAGRAVEAPTGEVPFALVGFAHPDWLEASTDPDDPAETLACLGHLLRHDGVAFGGDGALVSAAERLRAGVPAQRRISGPAATVRLYEVERDFSRYAAVPDGTWVIISEWPSPPLGRSRSDLPLDPRLRPVFISFHITPAGLAAPGVIDYLRRHGPIGCRDRDTVCLLLAAGVPAFFSGAISATIDNVVPPAATPPGSVPAARTLFIGVPADGPGEVRKPRSHQVKVRDLAENLLAAADLVREYRDSGARVVTSELRRYLAARAVGCPADLRPQDRSDYRVADFRELTDDDLAAMQAGISDKLAAVLGAVLAGHDTDAVYAAWRDACADAVAAAEAELHSVTDEPDPGFDLDEACRVIRSASVTVERATPADGTEVNVEFSVDQNYKHQLEIVLDSVVERTARPVRAYVLCRGFGQEDFDRLSRLFPSVSFVWLPTENVDYGPILGKVKWATTVTMDRTMLPVLLPEVDRIIHLDLDALCLDDLGALFDVDLEGTAIAAVDALDPIHIGGMDTFRRAARRLRRDGSFDLARELILRTHARHQFDFDVFNAGIMVLDLAKMRTDDVCRRYLGYVRRFGLNGQVIMNLYVGRERKKVSADWNRLMRLEVAGPPKIAHWAGPNKPWSGNHYVTGREWWQEQEQHFAART